MSDLVNADNFNRAESDMFFTEVVSEGGFSKFEHHREVMPVERQLVQRASRDTLYSVAVFDLDAGPVTVTLPDPGNRFMSLSVIDEEQYAVSVSYGAGTHRFTKDQVGTRYVMMSVRIMVDATNPDDIRQVHALQDAIKTRQSAPGRFEVPHWDRESQRKVREALLVLAQTVPDSRRMFGARVQVDPIRHLIGTAMGWGRNPERAVLYLSVTPRKNDGETVYRLTVRDVPVDGFWSISVYNERGYFEPNIHNVYSINSITAKKSKDGSIVVQFGGFNSKRPNCIPVPHNWNYMVRLYRPRPEVLTGDWSFPAAEPA